MSDEEKMLIDPNWKPEDISKVDVKKLLEDGKLTESKVEESKVENPNENMHFVRNCASFGFDEMLRRILGICCDQNDNPTMCELIGGVGGYQITLVYHVDRIDERLIHMLHDICDIGYPDPKDGKPVIEMNIKPCERILPHTERFEWEHERDKCPNKLFEEHCMELRFDIIMTKNDWDKMLKSSKKAYNEVENPKNTFKESERNGE